MTYEEFKKCLNVKTIDHIDYAEIRVSLTAYRSQCLPNSIFVAVSNDEIVDVLSQDMWRFFQYEFGRTDDDLRRAYDLGLRYAYAFERPDFEIIYQELSKHFHDPQDNEMIFKK